MTKKLPDIYAHKLDKKVDTIQEVFYSSRNDNPKPKPAQSVSNNYMSIDDKINKILSSPTYVYKADVVIVTDRGTLKVRMIGKNRDNIMTMDNKLIPIKDIKDIYLDSK